MMASGGCAPSTSAPTTSVVRQSREVGFLVDDNRVVLFVGQLVLAEGREEAVASADRFALLVHVRDAGAQTRNRV